MNKRNISKFTLKEPSEFYNKMLYWANQYNIFCLLDSNAGSNYKDTNYDFLIGIDSIKTISANKNCLSVLSKVGKIEDWLFGHINFELKEENENVFVKNSDFEIVNWFCPKIVIYFKNNLLTIESYSENNKLFFKEINNFSIKKSEVQKAKLLKSKITKSKYSKNVNKIKNHIQNGDCYELNYCIEYFSSIKNLDVVNTFINLNTISPNPFAAFYKKNNNYLLCASPERFLKKENQKIISQPIKGTIKRDLLNKKNDLKLKKSLEANPKEISENVMTVDLVRNDLSKVCKPKSVKKSNLLEAISFPNLHHLQSTIIGTLKNDMKFTDIINATFPMGSMTGVPKKRVLELIKKFEKSKRGIFSGTVGYKTPNSNFDLNVVIRSIMYNSRTKYLNCFVGSGITIKSNAEEEYNECLLKAEAIQKVLI